VFEDRSLKDLLIEAIRYGADPEVRARLLRKVEGALDTRHLEDIIKRNALCEEVMDEKRLFAVKEEMEKAEARKLQPFFIRSFFTQAFQQLGGELRPRATGPLRDHQRPGHHPRARPPDHRARPPQRRPGAAPLRARLLREAVRPRADRVGAPMASLLHPAHPLMQSVTDLVLEPTATSSSRAPCWWTPATWA
jgi:hypothetical protein